MDGETEEKAPLLTKDSDRTWPAWRVMILTATGCMYVVGIMPIALNAPLVPSLEDDPHLDWNEIHTGFVLSVPIVCESVGMICLGWLSDVYGGPRMLIFGMGTISIILGNITWQQNPVSILGLVIMLAFVRGAIWPSATKVMNTYLGAQQWEVGLCLIGLASRTGDVITSELTGAFVNALGWRSAVCIIAGVLLLSTFLFQFIIGRVQRMREEAGALERSRVEAERESNLAAPRWEDLKSFYSETDTLLLLLLTCSLQPLWVWGAYVGTFAHSIYGMTAANSAFTNGAFAFGQFVSLLCTLTIALCGGSGTRRWIYVGTANTCVVATVIPILFLLCEVPFGGFVALAAVLGLAVGTVDYVPVALYCMHSARRTGDYSLYCSSMYAIA